MTSDHNVHVGDDDVMGEMTEEGNAERKGKGNRRRIQRKKERISVK